jgi:hypothetical protein
LPTPPPAVRGALASLAEAEPMRRGSLSERYVKCSKEGCPCGETADARHGPYYSLTRAVAGRTQSRLLSAEQAERVRKQIEAGHRFRKRVEAYWEACEQWGDAELQAPDAAPAEGAQKRGSKRRLRRKSSPRSRRS